MRFHRLVAGIFILAACDSQPRPSSGSPATCGVTPTTVLSGYGIGALRVGATVPEVRAACEVVHDSTLEYANEGMLERRITVALPADTIVAVVDSDILRRLEVTTPLLRTADSLGVRTNARTLRDANATLAVGDRGVFALVPKHCGLSFHLADVRPDQASWTEVSDDAIVDRVLVFGCTAPP